MARAYPDFTVGEGDVISQQGSSSEWMYNVEVDAPADDPMVPLLAVAAPGTLHPDPRLPGLSVSGYRKSKRLNELWWKIIVIFSPLSDQMLGLWRRSVHYANETRPLYYSLANIDDAGRVLDESLPVGEAKYEIPPTETARIGTFELGDGTPVNQKAAIDPSRGGIDVNDGIMALSYEITVPQLSPQILKALMSFRWHTNNYEWMRLAAGGSGYEKWSLIFSNFAVEDHVVNLTGAGLYWFSDVSLEILYRPIHKTLNPYGWRGIQRPDNYSDDTHHRWAVYRVVGIERRIVVKNYVVYEEMPFSKIFRALGSEPVI